MENKWGLSPFILENAMAKGQQRSNREKKKPKQPKKPVAPVSPWKK
jgi:hypothetical protein